MLEIWLHLQQILQGFYKFALLFGVPMCEVRPLPMFQNAAACLVFNQPKRAHVTPLPHCWSSIKFKSLMSTSWVLSLLRLEQCCSRPCYPLTHPRSAHKHRLAKPSVQALQSGIISYRAPQWWEDIRSSVWAGATLSSFKKPLNHRWSLTESSWINAVFIAC